MGNGNIDGRKAIPGTFMPGLKDDKKDTATGAIIIKANPNYKETQEEYEEQFKFLIMVWDKFSQKYRRQ